MKVILQTLLLPCIAALPSLNLLGGKDGYLVNEYINAITAYGPGLGVYSPYSYVDIAYNNIPFVGKIPIFGKEGTSSGLGISPFYPPEGNPSNPFPPLYRARPLPLHVPEPQDVVAVPLDEEALHGEPLFPPELVLPGEQLSSEELLEEATQKPINPFGGFNDIQEIPEGFVEWQKQHQQSPIGESTIQQAKDPQDLAGDEIIITDNVSEKNTSLDDLKVLNVGRDGDQPKSFSRSKRIRR